jgi:DNA topoisomerase-3
LPLLTDGEAATLTDPKVEAKRTQPPPRYSEGTLVEAMQNAWRFVDDPALRERLKEAKGIGTPATRAEIIKGLKRQNLLAADGKFVVPTTAGLQIFELLRAAAPSLVDPGTTAAWEMQLDDIVSGRVDYRAVIDGIADVAAEIIAVLQAHGTGRIDLDVAAPTPSRRGARSKLGKPRKPAADAKPQGVRRRSARAVAPDGVGATATSPERPGRGKTSGGAPTAKMLAYARSLASNRNLALPPGCDQDFAICRQFLDQHAR